MLYQPTETDISGIYLVDWQKNQNKNMRMLVATW